MNIIKWTTRGTQLSIDNLEYDEYKRFKVQAVLACKEPPTEMGYRSIVIGDVTVDNMMIITQDSMTQTEFEQTAKDLELKVVSEIV